MKTIKKIKELKLYPSNPRIIKDDKFKKLVKSLQDFPEMLEVRPVVIDQEGFVLGGNMRLKAAKEAGLEELPVIIVDFNEEQKKEFIIKDNANYGDWDWELLNSDWDLEMVGDWGVDVFELPTNVDYSILDEFVDNSSIKSKLEQMKGGVKRSIMIEFEKSDYEEASKILKEHRDNNFYIGGFLIEKLKELNV